jgi:hypothetical protein
MAKDRARKSVALDGGGLAKTRLWDRTPGEYLAGRAAIDEVDVTASEMEAKWGADRLRLLVTPELREKFDRQRYKLNQAIWHGDLEAVRRESIRTITAWRTLDGVASSASKQALAPDIWEIPLPDGSVAALAQDGAAARAYHQAEGRAVAVYTLEEIARLITAMPTLMAIKHKFPGATVTASKRTVDDPLLSVGDTRTPLDEVNGDEMPF